MVQEADAPSTDTNVLDLMEALEKSVSAAKSARGRKKAAPRKRAAKAKKSA